jgi:NO-binding membrane sensor protein with MHYT domain
MDGIGLAAVQVRASFAYDLRLLGAAVLIAAGAATTAFWVALRGRGGGASLRAALILGAAVTGMHYTAMAGLRASASGLAVGLPAHQPPGAVTAAGFLLPLVIVVTVITFALVAIIAMPAATEPDAQVTAAERLEPGRPRGVAI